MLPLPDKFQNMIVLTHKLNLGEGRVLPLTLTQGVVPEN